MGPVETRTLESKVKEAIESVIDVNNQASDELVAEGILKALRGSHRTLQASFIRSLVLALDEYAMDDFDARNEGAVKWAAAATSKDIHIPFI